MTDFFIVMCTYSQVCTFPREVTPKFSLKRGGGTLYRSNGKDGYCTTRRNGKIDFFYRLPAAPRRLDVSQDVLGTTECASDRSGDAGCIPGRVVKSPAESARARAPYPV